jgi:hypothetical protein
LLLDGRPPWADDEVVYKLGFAVGSILRLLVSVLLISLAPVLMFWAYVVACIVWLFRRHEAPVRAPVVRQ